MPTVTQAFPKLPFTTSRDRDVYRTAQLAVRRHVLAISQLKRLRILRTGRAVQSDFAEWIAAKILRLDLAPNAVQESYDATDTRGAKYQIKARVTSSLAQSTSFDFRRTPIGFDFLVAVFFDEQYRVLGIAKIPRSVVVRQGSLTTARFSYRWNRRTRSDPRIVWVVPPNGAGQHS